MKFKLAATIPLVSYGNIQPEIELEGDDYEKLEKEALGRIKGIWDMYCAEPFPSKKSIGLFKEIETFTGEKVLYNDEAHLYTDLAGNKLVSGSEYSRMHQKPFDKARIIPMVSKKHGVPEHVIDAMWTANSKISTTFGTALHLAMEQWFRHKGVGTEKEYHLPKHPFLRNAVLTFPLKDELGVPEIMVSDVEKKMVGQIDNFILEAPGSSNGILVDYKSDADIEKNLEHHGLQLNFYRTILENKGYNVTSMQIWNFTDKWDMYEAKKVTIE